VAEFGRLALSGTPVGQLADEAVKLVASQLGVPYVTIVETVEGTSELTALAAVGLPDDLTAEPFLPRADEGQTGFTLASPEPVVVEDLKTERRFEPAQWVLDLGMRSTVSVPIGVHGSPSAVLAAASRRVADFSEEDVHFLEGMANTLAAATDRGRAELEVRESEARFREMADTAPVFIWTADAKGMIDFINRGWLDFTGRPMAEELGDTWDLGVHPDDAEGVRSTWWRAFNRRVPWEREYRLQRHDGEYRWIVDRGVPRFHGEELMGYVGTATDIHERKEMEEKLSRAAAADHEVAEVLQRSLLPESLPAIDGVEIEARYLPASRGAAIGGDWYDAIELEDGRVEVVVGDVVGHGLRAATVMGQLRNAFRAYALVETSPAQTLVRLNRLLAKDGRDLMATALCVAIDRDTGEIEVASAGHPPPLVIESGARAYYIEEGRSVPLGTADPAPYTESKTRLEPGSTLILYTDGLVERRDTSLDDRLAQLATVASVADGELGDVCDQLLEGSLGGKRPADDVAVLAIRLELSEPGRLSLRLPADPAALAQLRRRLGRFLEAAGAEEAERFEITLTVCEAAANAIEHAYGPGDAEFELDARTDGDLVQISVRDFGVWRERRGEDRGRGLTIMEGMMDEVEVSRTPKGTTVRMSRRLGMRAAA
jgi:PAS domain S-box-containing protein